MHSFNLDSPEVNHEPSPSSGANLARATAPSAVDPAYMELLTRHGGFYQLLDGDFVDTMISRIKSMQPGMAPGLIDRDTMVARARNIFVHLADQLPGGNRPYVLHSSLISHISFPNDGRVYSRPDETNDNEQIPAFMTFAGQFIDHDLTLNPMNLFDPQGGTVTNEASPFIDLDSVYGRVAGISMLQHGTDADIFDGDSFKLYPLEAPPTNAYDLIRDTTHGMFFDKPFMFDLRNDENQMILQIHILLMRVHNKLVTMGLSKNQARLEVERNWQSFILNEYLPTVVSAEPLAWVLGEIVKPNHGHLKHKPGPAPAHELKMPHEFSIGFRMGHTQLRDAYRIQEGAVPIRLFDNRSVEQNDLLGGRPLKLSHVIDWPFFSQPIVLSNKVDSKVTSVVFDLPEATIPDKVKLVGNLPQRNLIRSTQVDLAAGEDLAELYALPAGKQLTPEQVERDPEKRKLFQLDKDGNYQASNKARTPLWYYILKEAEQFNCGKQLGPLGGRIVSEVIAGGIYYYDKSFVHHAAWESKITNNRVVNFKDLVNFVTVPTPQKS